MAEAASLSTRPDPSDPCADPDQAEFPTEHHRRLNILAGAWDTSIVMIGADGNEGDRSQATDTYRWMPNGWFLVHEVDARIGDQRMQSMEIFGVDATTGEFPSRSYEPGGGIHDFVSRIDGVEYTILGDVQRFAGRFDDDGRVLRGEWEQFADGAWTPFIRIVLRKRA